MCYICKLKLHVLGGATGCLSDLGTAQFVMCVDSEVSFRLLKYTKGSLQSSRVGFILWLFSEANLNPPLAVKIFQIYGLK